MPPPVPPPLPLAGTHWVNRLNADEVPASVTLTLDPSSKIVWDRSRERTDTFIGLISIRTWRVYLRPVFYIRASTNKADRTYFNKRNNSLRLSYDDIKRVYGDDFVTVQELDANNQGISHKTAAHGLGLNPGEVLGFGLSAGAGYQERAELLVASGRNYLPNARPKPGGNQSRSGWGYYATADQRLDNQLQNLYKRTAFDMALDRRDDLYGTVLTPSEIKTRFGHIGGEMRLPVRSNQRFLPEAWRIHLFMFLLAALPLRGEWKIDDRN